MTVHGHQVKVKYWNRILEAFQMKFLDNKEEYIIDRYAGLLSFINYLWVYSGKSLEKSDLKYKLLSMNPHWYNLRFDYTENKMIQYAAELMYIIQCRLLKHFPFLS